MKKNIALKNQSPIVRPYVKIDFQNRHHNILGIRTSFGVIFHKMVICEDMLSGMQGSIHVDISKPLHEKIVKIAEFWRSI